MKVFESSLPDTHCSQRFVVTLNNYADITNDIATQKEQGEPAEWIQQMQLVCEEIRKLLMLSTTSCNCKKTCFDAEFMDTFHKFLKVLSSQAN